MSRMAAAPAVAGVVRALHLVAVVEQQVRHLPCHVQYMFMQMRMCLPPALEPILECIAVADAFDETRVLVLI